MTFRRIKRGLEVVSLVGGLVSAVACGGGSSTGSSYGMSPTQPNITPTPVAASLVVMINGMNGGSSFSPNPASVKAGQTIAWMNADSVTHTATGSSFDTGNIAPGATSAPVSFSATGSFDYHCRIHPSMVGSVSVTP